MGAPPPGSSTSPRDGGRTVLAMQYVIRLPADYDMGIIRHRVATRAAAMDAFWGLGLKAYGIRERSVDDAPVNEYAPFYLWTTLAGMNAFLWGDGFAGICRDFGRPEVRQWAGAGVVAGPARDAAAPPRLATRHAEPVSPDAEPRATVEAALATLAERSSTPGVHTSAVGVDARRWELVHFTLWADAAPADAGTRYTVLHLSKPALDALG